jgi:hypothetical protein
LHPGLLKLKSFGLFRFHGVNIICTGEFNSFGVASLFVVAPDCIRGYSN